MAGAEPEAEDSIEDGGGARAPPGRSGSTVRVAPLGPEQLRRVLEQVTKAQAPSEPPPPPPPPPPPFVLQDAVRRLRDAARQATLQRGPGAEPPRPPRLLPPQEDGSLDEFSGSYSAEETNASRISRAQQVLESEG